MATRGKPKSKGAAQKAAGGITSLFGGGKAAPGAGGASSARGGGRLFRVYADGSMVQISKPKRRRGYRMPRAMAEMIRAQTEMTRNMGMALLVKAAS